MRDERPRVALVAPYWDFWESSTTTDLRASRQGLVGQAAALLAPLCEVASAVVLDADSLESVAREVEVVPDVVVVMQTMATPPAVTLKLLERLDRVPVVLWVAPEHGRVTADFNHSDVTTEGATVGAPMLTSMFVRAGRSFELVVAPLDSRDTADRVGQALRDAIRLDRCRKARIGRVGRPIAGYDCVDLDPQRLESEVGPTVVDIEPIEYLDAYRSINDADLAVALESLIATSVLHDDVDHDSVTRAIRGRLALESLVDSHRLDAGAFNCHVPEIRLGEEIGIAPCFGLGCLTSSGVPWTCSGDVVTVVAMLLLKSLGAPALYHELEAVDTDTGVFVQANSGEHDVGLDPDAPLELRANPWFPGPPVSVCAVMSPQPGPATLVGFAQLDRPTVHRLIVAPGEFVGSGYPNTGTSNAGFRFRGRDALASWERWCWAGANHHGAVAPGDILPGLAHLATRLGLDLAVIESGSDNRRSA